MISDDERREVAKRLRNGGVARNSEEAYVLLLSRIGIRPQLPATNTYEDAMARLADLIDRPTCWNVSGYQDVFECSECRCRAELVTEVCNEYGEAFHVPLMPSFCPNCGAEVVRGDVDRLKGGVRTSYERDTRIPYRLGTDHYCEFEDDGGFVHMGDTVEVCEDCYDGQFSCTGKLLYVEYGSDGFITLVRVSCPSDENDCVCVDCDGVFFKPEKGAASD